jgi:hypothetical protein
MFRPRGPRGADRREFRLAGGYSAEVPGNAEKVAVPSRKRFPEQDLGKMSNMAFDSTRVKMDKTQTTSSAIEMEFPKDWPQNCPPTTASVAAGVVFRLVKTDLGVNRAAPFSVCIEEES